MAKLAVAWKVPAGHKTQALSSVYLPTPHQLASVTVINAKRATSSMVEVSNDEVIAWVF